MRFVAINNIGQQDVLMLLRMHQRVIEDRTALSNQIRGLLGEYGLILIQGISIVRRELPELLEDPNNQLSIFSRKQFNQLWANL